MPVRSLIPVFNNQKIVDSVREIWEIQNPLHHCEVSLQCLVHADMFGPGYQLKGQSHCHRRVLLPHLLSFYYEWIILIRVRVKPFHDFEETIRFEDCLDLVVVVGQNIFPLLVSILAYDRIDFFLCGVFLYTLDQILL